MLPWAGDAPTRTPKGGTRATRSLVPPRQAQRDDPAHRPLRRARPGGFRAARRTPPRRQARRVRLFAFRRLAEGQDRPPHAPTTSAAAAPAARFAACSATDRAGFIHFLAIDEGLKASEELMGRWLDARVNFAPAQGHVLIGPLKADAVRAPEDRHLLGEARPARRSHPRRPVPQRSWRPGADQGRLLLGLRPARQLRRSRRAPGADRLDRHRHAPVAAGRRHGLHGDESRCSSSSACSARTATSPSPSCRDSGRRAAGRSDGASSRGLRRCDRATALTGRRPC